MYAPSGIDQTTHRTVSGHSTIELHSVPIKQSWFWKLFFWNIPDSKTDIKYCMTKKYLENKYVVSELFSSNDE